MNIDIAPHPVRIPHGTLVVVFAKVVYTPDATLLRTLQTDGVIEDFKFVARALNTKVLGLPWILPRNSNEVAAQKAALQKHAAITEVCGFAIPPLRHFYMDTDHRPKAVPYIDGGELVLAMAEASPEELPLAMPYLRAPQRHDWFIDRLFAIAEKTKDAKHAAKVWEAIAEMPVPPKSNQHHKTYALALERGASAFREAGDSATADRLAARAATLSSKPKKVSTPSAAKGKGKQP